MLVLQDFEAMTPNILARTIETVEGGGMVILLLPGMTSLKQLYTMTMDIHQRFRPDGDQLLTPRFNERFLLSLSSCHSCLVLDDELNILPLSSHVKDIKAVVLQDETRSKDHILSEAEKELADLRESLKDTQPIGSLIEQARTLDQAKGILQFVEAISEKTLQTTVALTAARGRGKSAALGISIAAAVAYGYSNIFVTSPSPENLKTLFEFVFKGFDALGYKDQTDYEIVQSQNPAFNKAVVRVNIYRQHRQTIQYIQPQDHQKLGQAELLVIDEAAAIPLPLVRKLLGPYLIYISSTVNGYEGTGRSLSLKLIQELREKSNQRAGSRTFHQITLNEPIRYGTNDQVEQWLTNVLCLDATQASQIINKCPHPSQCQLYYVNRDTLFSYNAASESFLHKMMSLYVASHYKNTPNDLQIMSDAPNHLLFVLLGPIDANTNALPDVYTVIQVGLEGNINKETVMAQLSRGQSPTGDLIPYLVSRQYQESDFALLSGARIIRIATHPDYIGTGYGQRAMDQLIKYFQGDLLEHHDDDEDDEDEEDNEQQQQPSSSSSSIQDESISPRDKTQLPPLLQRLDEREPEPIQYLGVSYGMTSKLFSFWKRLSFKPLYVRLSHNDLTGEHTCVMLRSLSNTQHATRHWLDEFHHDFKKRFLNLLGYEFREFHPELTLGLLDYQQSSSTNGNGAGNSLNVMSMDDMLSTFDLKRLNSYSNNLVDYHVVMDILPILARWFFTNKIHFQLSFAQAAILCGLGLQHKRLEQLEKELDLPSNQLLALFNKCMRKFTKSLKQVEKQRGVVVQPSTTATSLKSVNRTKGNVSTTELESDEEQDDHEVDMKDDDEEEVEKKEANVDQKVLDLFEKSTSDQEEEEQQEDKNRFRMDNSKKRLAPNAEPEQAAAMALKKARREKNHNGGDPFIQQVLRDDAQYKLTGVTNQQLQKGLESSGNDGVVSIQTAPQERVIKKYMLKDQKQIDAEQREEKNKLYKTGGKKKRKLKK
ncbi:N-acetyltransferase [Acrasis kona]|uniref:RNA cytidine acetyltransferase n=1 Tax=Acrasis kona TaxID=1008807 RepID=A0AAW2YPZ8_9EUKA